MPDRIEQEEDDVVNAFSLFGSVDVIVSNTYGGRMRAAYPIFGSVDIFHENEVR